MATAQTYVEETFGILTDDELYLDCVLVKPAAATDEDLRVLRVWVPKFPLTKTSVISCARQEVKSYGANGKIAHLVFDLRGTGESDGILGDQNYRLDLHAIKEWAHERFGPVNFGFLGFPTIEEFATVNVWPLRAGAVMESYMYRAAGSSVAPATIIYLSSYGNFGRKDEELCVALADAGYDVLGLDPLRYLLHANINACLTPEMLAKDMRELIQMLPNMPIIIGQPLAAGLALTWAAEVQRIRGVVAIGPAPTGLSLKHIFDIEQPSSFQLSRHIGKIAPRPLALVIPSSRRKAKTEQELTTLFKISEAPHRLEHTDKVDSELLLDLLNWIDENQA
jgi:hypothetical protein